MQPTHKELSFQWIKGEFVVKLSNPLEIMSEADKYIDIDLKRQETEQR